MVELHFGDVQAVRDITRSMIKDIRGQNLRPGIKALFYNPQLGEVLMGTLPVGYPLRFNLPGGGIDARQMPATALCREIEEELGILTYRPQAIASLPVVAQGELPLPRDGYRGKYEFIVALPHPRLDGIKAQLGSKMLLWSPMDWRAAQVEVLRLAYGGTEMVSMYAKALAAIPNLLDR